MSYKKQWFLAPLAFHSNGNRVGIDFDAIDDNCGGEEACGAIIGMYLHWLRDYVRVPLKKEDVREKTADVGVCFPKVTFVIENFVMILMLCFSQHSNSWFLLSVTECVCLNNVLGSIMRIAGYCVLSKGDDIDT